MTVSEFLASVASGSAPPGAPLLHALWLDARGDWEGAHRVAQEVDTADGAWVHAYLHRKEGDLGNARYWYRRAGRDEAVDALEVEWTRLVEALLPADRP